MKTYSLVLLVAILTGEVFAQKDVKTEDDQFQGLRSLSSRLSEYRNMIRQAQQVEKLSTELEESDFESCRSEPRSCRQMLKEIEYQWDSLEPLQAGGSRYRNSLRRLQQEELTSGAGNLLAFTSIEISKYRLIHKGLNYCKSGGTHTRLACYQHEGARIARWNHNLSSDYKWILRSLDKSIDKIEKELNVH